MYTGSSFLNYIPNITSISITNCTSLRNTNGEFVFTNIPNLEVLSLSGCTGLSGDIDLSTNTEITDVNVQNTSLNVILPTASKITNL